MYGWPNALTAIRGARRTFAAREALRTESNGRIANYEAHVMMPEPSAVQTHVDGSVRLAVEHVAKAYVTWGMWP